MKYFIGLVFSIIPLIGLGTETPAEEELSLLDYVDEVGVGLRFVGREHYSLLPLLDSSASVVGNAPMTTLTLGNQVSNRLFLVGEVGLPTKSDTSFSAYEYSTTLGYTRYEDTIDYSKHLLLSVAGRWDVIDFFATPYLIAGGSAIFYSYDQVAKNDTAGVFLAEKSKDEIIVSTFLGLGFKLDFFDLIHLKIDQRKHFALTGEEVEDINLEVVVPF